MNVVTGALGSLLPMLAELLKEEYKLQTGVKKDIESIQRELGSMDAALRMVAEVPREQLDEQARHWSNEVRELSYDADDIVDAFLVRLDANRLTASHGCFKRLREKMANLLKKVKARRQIAIAIRDLKAQVLDVAARRDRYRVNNVVVANPPATIPTLDPRLLSLYKDKKEIVGIQEPMDSMIKRLTDEDGDNGSKRQLKIVSILGFGGLGKTTLAKAVYDRLQWQFDCRSFVSVGRNADVKKVLKEILLQLDKQKYVTFNMAIFDERQLIDEVRGILEKERTVEEMEKWQDAVRVAMLVIVVPMSFAIRYLIVIDDIWDITTWGIIRCALVDSCLGSKIITTTRISDVASKAGDIYKLDPLSHDNSKELFYKRLLGGNERSHEDELSEVSEKLLHKCGGVPLAIITVASMLASKPRHDWPKVYNSIGFGDGENEEVQNTRKILLFSYYDLPSCLKTCLLHLCSFPEDHLINKRNLIWKWIAEGFVKEESRIGSFEQGERYFNELINRSMIQPVQKPDLGVINGCRVHDMVLDMISSISKEENFVNILNSHDQQTSSQNKARRLAILKRDVNQDDPLDNMWMPHMRSFNAIKCHFSMTPSFSNFQVLRVLAMEYCTFMGNDSWHLENLGKLLQLRFLGLRGTPVSELPKEIGNLMFLQTLDLKHTQIKELPQSVGLLRQLKCLYTDFGLSDWIGNLTSLQELWFTNVSKSPNFMEELGKLTQLRVFQIWIWQSDGILKRPLVGSLGKMQNIQILRVLTSMRFNEDDWEGFVPPRQLQELCLISSYRMPSWIDSSLLPNLCHLDLTIKTLYAQDLEILGTFPELLTLKLCTSDRFSFEVMGSGTFPKLRYFHPEQTLGHVTLRFLQGAMPSLESIQMVVKVSNNFDFGSLRNLTCLEKVTVEMDCMGARKIEVEEEKAALRQAIDNHPNSPTLHLRTVWEGIYTDSDSDTSSDQEELEEESITESQADSDNNQDQEYESDYEENEEYEEDDAEEENHESSDSETAS